MVSEECKTLYNKLNTFVTKVINRDVQPQIDSLNNSPTNISKEILENDDLNDYSDIGFYYCPFTSVAQTLSNCPVTNAFALFVEKYSGYDNACTQTVTTYTGTRLLKFIRTFQTMNGTFQHSGWQLLYDDTGWVEMTPNSSNWQKSTGSGCWYRRKGNNVTVTINVKGTKNFSDNTVICRIPSSIAPTHRLEYGGATNNLIFGGFIETDGSINIRRPYLGGNGTNWSTSTWVGFSFSYVL